jgi:hypothetical protein
MKDVDIAVNLLLISFLDQKGEDRVGGIGMMVFNPTGSERLSGLLRNRRAQLAFVLLLVIDPTPMLLGLPNDLLFTYDGRLLGRCIPSAGWHRCRGWDGVVQPYYTTGPMFGLFTGEKNYSYVNALEQMLRGPAEQVGGSSEESYTRFFIFPDRFSEFEVKYGDKTLYWAVHRMGYSNITFAASSEQPFRSFDFLLYLTATRSIRWLRSVGLFLLCLLGAKFIISAVVKLWHKSRNRERS